MNLSSRALAALLVVIFVSGCGQSGKLYVPGDPSVIGTPPTTAQSAEVDKEDEKEDDSEEKSEAK